MNPAVLGFVSAIYGAFAQIMETQVKVLTTLLSALGAFCLFEPRVARICPGNLLYICLDNGNASQGADNTSVRARGVQYFCPRSGRFVCGNSAFSQQISTFYGPSVQAMETRLGARQRRRPPTVHRGRTHAPRLQRPVASEDQASACSEVRLGCHPETPVIEPCQARSSSPSPTAAAGRSSCAAGC